MSRRWISGSSTGTKADIRDGTGAECSSVVPLHLVGISSPSLTSIASAIISNEDEILCKNGVKMFG